MTKKTFKYLLFFLIALFLSFSFCNKSDHLTKLGWSEMQLIHLGIKRQATMALNYFDMALLQNPKNVRALHGMGVILTANSKSFQNGVAKLEKSYHLDKKYIYPCIDLAIIYYKKGLQKDLPRNKIRKYKKLAIETIEEGLKANPESVNLFLSRANFFALNGKYKEANKDVTIAKSLNAENPNILYSLALINFQKDLLSKVLEIANTILKRSHKADKIAIKAAVIKSFVLQKLQVKIIKLQKKLQVLNDKNKVKNKNTFIEKLELQINNLIVQKNKIQKNILKILKGFFSNNPFYQLSQEVKNKKMQFEWPTYAFPRFNYEN